MLSRISIPAWILLPLAAVLAAPVIAGPEWVARASGQTRTLNAVAWTGSLLAAVGDNGTVLTSPDGIQWTRRSSGSSQALNGVAGRDSLLVAVGDNGRILTSPDGGASWNTRTSGTTRAFYGVLRTSALFVAVGSQGTLYTSPNGVDWTARASNTSTDLNAVAWNGNRIVIVGDNGVIRTSLDGIQWTDASVNTSNLDVDAVVWTGSRFVALGEKGVMLTSPDGLTWASTTGPGTVLGVAWDGSRLVAVGSNGSGWISSDGNAWTPSPPGTAQALRAVAWTGARLVAVSGGGVVFTAEPEAPPTAPPQAPVLTFPDQFATGISLQARLRWNASATAALYRIQVSRVPDFSTLVLDDSTSSLFFDLSLSVSGEYFWRVRAWNVVGNGPWSEIRAFKTVVAIPPAPVLSYPEQYAEDVPLPVTLRWQRVAGATSYALQMSRSPDFASLVASADAVSDTQWTAAALEGNVSYYYWRVRAVNAAGAGSWSTIRRFTTGPAPIPLGIARPGAFTLLREAGQGGARVRFTLAKTERVRIRLLDASGREAAPVLERVLGAGTHEIPVASPSAEAWYLLDVRAGSRREILDLCP